MDCEFYAVEDHGNKYEVITLSGKSGISIGLGMYSTKEKDLEEIKQKYGFTLRPSAFNGKPIKYVSREEYEEKINKVWNQIFENDSKKEQEELEKELRKKQNASLRKLKKMVQIKKETDEFVKKLKEENND